MRQRSRKEKSADKSVDSKHPQHVQQPVGRSCCHFMILVVLIMMGVSGVVVYFLPSLIGPVGHGPDDGPQFTGVYAVNNELQNAKRIFEGELYGPESFALDKDGYLYTGLMDGRVVKINLHKETYTLVTRMNDPPYDKCGSIDMLPVCGRPLGMKWDINGKLIIVDAYKGLVSINTTTGEQEQLSNPEDISCTFYNNPVVLSNGSIFFSCFSVKFGLHDLFAEHFPLDNYQWDHSQEFDYGMLLHYNPTTGKTVAVGEKRLFVPNGVAKSSDEQFLIVAELARNRIARYYLKGPKEGQWDMFISSLPGVIDNITPSKKHGGFWVTIPMVNPSALLDFSQQWSWLQLILAKLQLVNELDHPGPLHNMILLVDEEGRVVKSLHDMTGKVVVKVSEVFEMDDEVIIGSFFTPFLVRMKEY
ncbi:adipocyte plasma membrane-associated protein-like isoform X2 [Dysidea avara]